jgi:hypothetical protein
LCSCSAGGCSNVNAVCCSAGGCSNVNDVLLFCRRMFQR